MYALNIAPDGRCLSAAPANMAPIGATMVPYLPEGNLYDYLYVNGNYIYDPLPKPEVEVTVVVTESELAELQAKAAAYDILTEGVTI